MLTLDELLFLSNEELIAGLEQAIDHANQEFAHQLGDEILIIFLLRSVEGEVSPLEVSEVIEAYQELSRSFS